MLKKGVKISFLIYLISLFTIAEHDVLYVLSNLLFLVYAMVSVCYLLYYNRIVISKFFLGFMGFGVYAVLSCLWTPDLSNSLVRVMTILQLLVLFFLVYNVFSEKQMSGFLVNSLWIAGLCLCIFFLSQYPISEIIKSYGVQMRLGEKIGPLNAVGRNLAIFIVVNVYKIFVEYRWRYIPTCMLGVWLLSATQSRSSLLLCIAGTGIILLYIAKKNKSVGILMIMLGVFALLIVINSSMVQAMFWRVYKMLIFLSDTSNNQVDYSAFVRLGLIKQGIDFWLERPILGHGIASGYKLLGGGYGKYFHNNFVQLLVEVGVVGMLLYYIPIFSIIKQKMEQSVTGHRILAIALVVLLIVGDITNSTYYHKITYVLLGITVCISQNKKSNK